MQQVFYGFTLKNNKIVHIVTTLSAKLSFYSGQTNIEYICKKSFLFTLFVV